MEIEYLTGIALVKYAQQQIEKNLTSGDYVIDATVGNGHDTLFLARHIGSDGKVFGFDLQSLALHKTCVRLQQAGMLDQRIELFRASHAQMLEYLSPAYNQRIAAVMFNLGYLPGGGNKTIITQADTTLPALNASLKLLKGQGCISIMVYPGHPGGFQESLAVYRWCRQLHPRLYKTRASYLAGVKKAAPSWLYITKAGGTLAGA